MKIQLVGGEGNVIETIETTNIEVSDDFGFSVDYLREANDELADGVAEIRILAPDQS